MTRQRQRVEELERAAGGPGGVEFVGMGRWDWTPEQLAAAVAEAEQRVGPGGVVIPVCYVSDWRGPMDRDGFPLVEGVNRDR